MSKHNWKPGDVAVVDYGFGGERMMRDHRGWCSPTTEISDTDESVTSARPLVVIDPEDREQVERLAVTYERAKPGTVYTADAMQAALREFANPTPPKPEEPTGLGAVVEDAPGGRWVRVKSTTTVRHWRHEFGGDRKRYADIAVAKVLSEGVTE